MMRKTEGKIALAILKSKGVDINWLLDDPSARNSKFIEKLDIRDIDKAITIARSTRLRKRVLFSMVVFLVLIFIVFLPFMT